MHTLFTTYSGSTYELDAEHKRIRRVAGQGQPTPRTGKDGEWRDFADCSDPVKGQAVCIVWRWDGPIARSTITSYVTDVVALAEDGTVC